jgi:hypothetical protein
VAVFIQPRDNQVGELETHVNLLSRYLTRIPRSRAVREAVRPPRRPGGTMGGRVGVSGPSERAEMVMHY